MNTQVVGRRLLKLKDVRNVTALSTSSIYAKMSAGTFPKPVSLGMRSVAWVDSEVHAWVEKVIAESRVT